MRDLKEILKQRFEQIDIWISSNHIEILLTAGCLPNAGRDTVALAQIASGS
jgi:hypothetical protein